MTCPLKRDQLHIIPAELCGLNIPFADFKGNVVIIRAVKQLLRDTEWQLFYRRSEVISVRNFIRTTAEKIGNNGIAEFELPCATQVKHARQGNRSRENRLARRQPEREMASGRVTDCNYTIQVKMKSRCDRRQITGSRGHIVKCSWPTAAGIPDPTILEIPGRKPGISERFANRPHVFEIIFRAPESSVYDNHNGMKSRCRRKPELSKLMRIGSVWNPLHPLASAFCKEIGRAHV